MRNHQHKYIITGLFHRAIAESGSALCPWAIVDTPLKYAQDLAALFQCPTENTTELVNCLRQQDAGQIQMETAQVMVRTQRVSATDVLRFSTNNRCCFLYLA